MNSLEIIALGERILSGWQITRDEADELTTADSNDIPLLAAYAHKIRNRFAGDSVDMCGIISARSGMCSEDCKFCAQSCYHQTNIAAHPLQDMDKIVETAKKAEAEGARRLSIVTSGKGMECDPDFPQILKTIAAVIANTGLAVCANLGTINPDQARQLAAAGVKRYAHNLETSQHFYPKMCTTHPYQERLTTIAAAKSAGMELCTGGIIGLGETWSDRLDLAFVLRDLGVHSIPLNILNPIQGTALEAVIPPMPLEIIQTFAIFRFILPERVIRPAGGRELNLRDMQGALMLAGANGLIIGNYLTFSGRDAAADFKMVADAGLSPNK